MAIYSHSRIGTFESCPQKYKFQYVDRIKGDIESIEAFLGSRVHEALEKLYNLVRNGRLPTEDEVLACYESQWDANWNNSVKVVEPDLKPEYYRGVGRQCVRDYYRHYQPFNQSKVVAIEQRISINLDPAGRYQMVGFIDRVDKASDGVFEIHDYKTNRSLPSQQDKDQDRQLALYEIGLRDYLGNSNVREIALVWHYVRFDQEIRSRRTGQKLEELRAAMIARIQEIEASTAANNFPTHESNLCNWCEYRPICPIWKHLYVTQENAAQPVLLPDDGPALVNRLADLDRQRKELKGRVDGLEAEMGRIKESLIRYARENGLQRVFGADHQATVTQKAELKIPTKTNQPEEHEEMLALLRQSPFWPQLTDFSAAKLKEVLDTPEGQTLRAQLVTLVKEEATWRLSLAKKRDLE
jgi:putative RecB family exonuclease